MDRGIERQAKGDLDGAIEDFTKTISLKPQPLILAAAYNNRANALISKHDLAGAISDYGKAIEVLPGDPENYYNRGVLFLNQSDYDQAIADFSKAIELAPGLTLAYNNRANARKAKVTSKEPGRLQ